MRLKKKKSPELKESGLIAEASGSAIFFNLDRHAEPLGPASEAELGRGKKRHETKMKGEVSRSKKR